MANKMNYNFTNIYQNPEDRIIAIENDILTEYPRLEPVVEQIAKMERPFGRVNEDYMDFAQYENEINRLINIIIVTEGKPDYTDEFQKACKDFIESYKAWDRNFTYGGKESQPAYLVFKNFSNHFANHETILITYNEACEILFKQREEKRKQQQWIYDHTMRYNFTAYCLNDEDRIKLIVEDLLREYPNLAPIAEEIAKMETPFGQVNEDYDRFAPFENQINRLIDIIIVTEGRKEYANEFFKARSDFEEAYANWNSTFTYGGKERESAYLVYQAYLKHLKDPNSPLITFKEAYNQRHL